MCLAPRYYIQYTLLNIQVQLAFMLLRPYDRSLKDNRIYVFTICCQNPNFVFSFIYILLIYICFSFIYSNLHYVQGIFNIQDFVMLVCTEFWRYILMKILSERHCQYSFVSCLSNNIHFFVNSTVRFLNIFKAVLVV